MTKTTELAARIKDSVRADLEGDAGFMKRIVDAVVAKVVSDPRLVAAIAERAGEAAITGIASAFAAVPETRRSSKPSGGSAAKKVSKAPAKRTRKTISSPTKKAGPLTPPQQKVHDAILAGRDTKAAIMKQAKIAGGQYRAAIKGLKTRGLLKIVGTRGQAKISIATK